MHAGKTLVHMKSKQQEGKNKNPRGVDAHYSQHFRGRGRMIPTSKSSLAIFQVRVKRMLGKWTQAIKCLPVWSSAPSEKTKQCICNPSAGDGRYLPIPRVPWLSSLTIRKASERYPTPTSAHSHRHIQPSTHLPKYAHTHTSKANTWCLLYMCMCTHMYQK